MLSILVIALFLQRVTDGVIKIRREFGLRLFCVREGFTPGVIDLVVPTIGNALADLRLQPVVARPAAAADVVSREGVTIRRQEEAWAQSGGCRRARLSSVEEGVARGQVV